jgi:hypothetical protein
MVVLRGRGVMRCIATTHTAITNITGLQNQSRHLKTLWVHERHTDFHFHAWNELFVVPCDLVWQLWLYSRDLRTTKLGTEYDCDFNDVVEYIASAIAL